MKTRYALIFLLFIDLSVASERVMPVRITEVKRAPILEEIRLTGVMSSQHVSSLTSRVDAMVTRVRVKEGDFVDKDETLIELDGALAEFDVNSAKAAWMEAKARLQESIRLRDELGKLIKNQYLAKSSYESAKADVGINQAIAARLKTEYERNEELLNRHAIKAPYHGVINKKMVESGQWIKVGNSVLELVDVDSLWAEVAVPQRFFSQLHDQTLVQVYPDALPGQAIQTRISNIVPVANDASHTFPVYIEMDNSNRLYTPGMTVRVVFQLSTDQSGAKSLQVPRDALIKNNNQDEVVWRVTAHDKTQRADPVKVSTGRVQRNMVEILSGNLEEGDLVVIRGNEILKPGQTVTVHQ